MRSQLHVHVHQHHAHVINCVNNAGYYHHYIHICNYPLLLWYWYWYWNGVAMDWCWVNRKRKTVIIDWHIHSLMLIMVLVLLLMANVVSFYNYPCCYPPAPPSAMMRHVMHHALTQLHHVPPSSTVIPLMLCINDVTHHTIASLSSWSDHVCITLHHDHSYVLSSM